MRGNALDPFGQQIAGRRTAESPRLRMPTIRLLLLMTGNLRTCSQPEELLLTTPSSKKCWQDMTLDEQAVVIRQISGAVNGLQFRVQDLEEAVKALQRD